MKKNAKRLQSLETVKSIKFILKINGQKLFLFRIYG